MSEGSYTQQVARTPSRPQARELRLSSSFQALVDAAGTSGLNTPTTTLLGRASDIISRSVDEGARLRSPRGSTPDPSEAPAGGSKLRSCLSLRRHSDNPVPSTSVLSAGGASLQFAEHKGLHWKPELVAPSTATQRADSRELQVRYIKLEADLKDSEAARAMLQKQVHRVQEAMVQSRDDMENAQRLALAAKEKAEVAEAKAAAAEAKAEALSAQVIFESHQRLGGTFVCLAYAAGADNDQQA